MDLSSTLPGRGVLEGAFQILRALEQATLPLRVGDVSQATGMPKQTVSRLLRQMEAVGAVERVPDGIVMGPSMFIFGAQWPAARTGVVAAPALSALHARTGATVHLATLVNGSVVYVSKLSGAHGAKAPSVVGGSQEPTGSAVGKALLSGLSPAGLQAVLAGTPARNGIEMRMAVAEVSRVGVAFDLEEIATGLCCVAAPVVEAGGAVVAALSLSVPADRPLRPLIAEVRAAARVLGAIHREQSR
ncbi:IclR family transcriptional regulator [Streptomyces sp. NPDC088752]|uniref:IclR family transcriptional regulator n=1 Tax=Streptomyces sp. NPDC088752 TaxID=3154963 RepID=UPI003445100E